MKHSNGAAYRNKNRSERFEFRLFEFGQTHRDRIGFRVVFWETMTWTRDEVEELRDGVDEVDCLWNEEKHEGLAEMSQNRDDGECHSGPIAERVTDEDTRRVLIKIKKHSGTGGEREQKVQRDDVMPESGRVIRAEAVDLHKIEQANRGGNDERLAAFESVDSSQNIDRVGAEYDHHSHEYIIDE